MNTITTKPLYEAAYIEREEVEWRRVCAIDKAANVVRLCSDISQDSVLEIGCGTGAILSRLSELNFGSDLIGVELSESAANICRNIGLNVDLIDGAELPYSDKQFDLVILSHVVEHLEHPRQLLYEAARVGRNVFIEVPLEDNLRLAQNHVPDHVGHINHYNPTTIRRLLQTCGMAVSKELITNPSPAVYRFNRGYKGVASWALKELTLRLARPIAPLLWTYHYSALANRALLHSR